MLGNEVHWKTKVLHKQHFKQGNMCQEANQGSFGKRQLINMQRTKGAGGEESCPHGVCPKRTEGPQACGSCGDPSGHALGALSSKEKPCGMQLRGESLLPTPKKSFPVIAKSRHKKFSFWSKLTWTVLCSNEHTQLACSCWLSKVGAVTAPCRYGGPSELQSDVDNGCGHTIHAPN